MNRGCQFYRCPFWQDKTVDCKFFRWASDRQQTAESPSWVNPVWGSTTQT
ncbi:hypothetical protein LINGRAHAP2_LOCUS23338 [Linum grandiflorum]